MLDWIFSSFDPVKNPIGFGAVDFIEIAVALPLLLLVIFWRHIEPLARRLSANIRWSMIGLAIAPVVLRLLLLAHHPIPKPDIYDEFGHLFVADTLRHFRLANPPLALHQFFETFFILQTPTFSSIYPIGQGALLAIGRAIAGTPWAGVLLASAAFGSLCYWMLRAWTSPGWALLGGVLAIAEFGPLNPWMNTYWGGMLAAAAGCMVFGALPRLAKKTTRRNAVLLCAGMTVHLLTRPYESIFLILAAALFFLPTWKRTLPLLALAILPGAIVTLAHNKSVTGQFTKLPYQLSQEQYGVPAALTFQAEPVPHSELTPQQQMEYKSQMSFKEGKETLLTYLLRLEYRVRYYRFFFFAPLYLALPAFLFAAARSPRYAFVAMTLALLALGTNFFPAFQVHYLGAAACLFVLVSVAGLEQIALFSPESARLLAFLCLIHFGFWYAIHLSGEGDVALAAIRYESWDNINHRNPERRILVEHQLEEIPGQLLVFVRYTPRHIFQDEWVYNEASPAEARIVWARDLGPEENSKLRAIYPNRQTLLLEPDARTPVLSPY